MRFKGIQALGKCGDRFRTFMQSNGRGGSLCLVLSGESEANGLDRNLKSHGSLGSRDKSIREIDIQ